jgi:hypothetical protein
MRTHRAEAPNRQPLHPRASKRSLVRRTTGTVLAVDLAQLICQVGGLLFDLGWDENADLAEGRGVAGANVCTMPVPLVSIQPSLRAG